MKRFCAIIGIILFLIPVFMVIWSVLDYLALKSTIYAMDDKMAKMEATGLVYKFGSGIYLGLLGIMVLGFTMDGMNYRPKWLFWWLCCLSMIWLFYYPAGTAIGFVVLLYIVLNKSKFTKINKKNTEPTASQGPQGPCGL